MPNLVRHNCVNTGHREGSHDTERFRARVRSSPRRRGCIPSWRSLFAGTVCTWMAFVHRVLWRASSADDWPRLKQDFGEPQGSVGRACVCVKRLLRTAAGYRSGDGVPFGRERCASSRKGQIPKTGAQRDRGSLLTFAAVLAVSFCHRTLDGAAGIN